MQRTYRAVSIATFYSVCTLLLAIVTGNPASSSFNHFALLFGRSVLLFGRFFLLSLRSVVSFGGCVVSLGKRRCFSLFGPDPIFFNWSLVSLSVSWEVDQISHVSCKWLYEHVCYVSSPSPSLPPSPPPSLPPSLPSSPPHLLLLLPPAHPTPSRFLPRFPLPPPPLLCTAIKGTTHLYSSMRSHDLDMPSYIKRLHWGHMTCHKTKESSYTRRPMWCVTWPQNCPCTFRHSLWDRGVVFVWVFWFIREIVFCAGRLVLIWVIGVCPSTTWFILEWVRVRVCVREREREREREERESEREREITCTFSNSLPSTYITLWIKKAPPSILEKPFRVIVYGFHYLRPVQALDALSVLDITGAVEGGREGGTSTDISMIGKDVSLRLAGILNRSYKIGLLRASYYRKLI